MKLLLQRFDFGANYTVGRLFIDGKEFCYTLEDVVRLVGTLKVAGATAIPTGTYKVVIDMSTRFKHLMPHILDVPGFDGIRIHAGNTDKDTEGCILLGTSHSGDYVGNSRIAFGQFFPILQTAINLKEQVLISIL
jgi:hypothetical protein